MFMLPCVYPFLCNYSVTASWKNLDCCKTAGENNNNKLQNTRQSLPAGDDARTSTFTVKSSTEGACPPMPLPTTAMSPPPLQHNEAMEVRSRNHELPILNQNTGGGGGGGDSLSTDCKEVGLTPIQENIESKGR